MKNDIVQSFTTRWPVTIIAMKKQPDDEILELVYHRRNKSQKDRHQIQRREPEHTKERVRKHTREEERREGGRKTHKGRE